jgi:hypothetical protein
MKVAVIMNSDNIMIRELPDDFDFSAGISAERITELAERGTAASSIFSLAH